MILLSLLNLLRLLKARLAQFVLYRRTPLQEMRWSVAVGVVKAGLWMLLAWLLVYRAVAAVAARDVLSLPLGGLGLAAGAWAVAVGVSSIVEAVVRYVRES